MSCKSLKCNPNDGKKAEEVLDPLASPPIVERMKDMLLDNATLKKEMEIFLDNVEKGLKKATNPTAIIKCYPTYVQDLPNRTEEGKFFALDLGGTNFRVLLITLEKGNCDVKFKTYVIPPDIMVGTGAALFDHIAKCLAEFANEYKVANDNLPLGFTFSFPVTQNGLCSGVLVKWTKGFNCEDVVGQDVVPMLIDAINRRGDVKLDVCAILNDTLGTLMACAWKNPNCRIGYIVGTGSNGCYVETQANAELFNDPDMGSGKIIINLEMGAFGEDGAIDFMRTAVDKTLDERSIHPGKQIHEKMVAGMYLGEITRLRTLELIKDNLIFDSAAAAKFEKEGVITSKIISTIESEPVKTFDKIKKILGDIGISGPKEQDMLDFRYICSVVTRRSAFLVSTSLCVLIKKMGEPYVVVGIDGSVYKHHPHFRRIMSEKMTELMAPGFTFDLMLSEDGSGRGAALVAAVAARKKKEIDAKK